MKNFNYAESKDDFSSANNFDYEMLLADFPYTFLSKPDLVKLSCLDKDARWVIPDLIPAMTWLLAVNENINTWSGIFGVKAGKSYARAYIQDCLYSLCRHFPAVQCTVDWVVFDVFGELRPSIIEIAKYRNQGGQSLLEKMWSGPGCLIQGHLLRQHLDDVVWPQSPIIAEAWSYFSQHVTDQLSRLTMEDPGLMGRLFWGEVEDYRYLVANLPVLLGFWSMTATPMTWWHCPSHRDVVAQVRAFNPTWFDLAYQHGAMLAVVLGVQFNHEDQEDT